MSRRTHSGGAPLLRRLMGAMALVVVAGAGTLIAVSLLLAPTIFYFHLENAGVARDSALAQHVDEGFTTAVVISTVVGVAAAGITATALAVLVARRISRPITEAADAAMRLANGDYSTRVPAPAMGPELESLTGGINALAQRLEDAEGIRMRLMGDLAHNLRTPLAAIEATVEAIADGVLPADEQALASLRGSAERLSRLVDDLSSVSRAQERAFRLELGVVDLSSVARRAANEFAALASMKGVLVSSPVGDGPLVRADAGRVVEVVGQLLENALAASGPGGSVSLTVSESGPMGELSVTDEGVGFDPADVDRLFQRFYRGSARASNNAGSGIGLTIALTLIQAQGGNLVARSAGEGTGASFTVRLPRV